MARKTLKTKGKNETLDNETADTHTPIQASQSRLGGNGVRKMANKTDSKPNVEVPDATITLIFEVPARLITVGKAKSGPSAGAEFINLPYQVNGKFGEAPAYIKGGRVIIPAHDTDPKKQKTNKPSALPADVAARIGIKV